MIADRSCPGGYRAMIVRASSAARALEHDHQRSTPPITGSSDAIAAIRSATR